MLGLRLISLLLVASSLFLIGGDSVLTVDPVSILSGGKLCPDAVVRFTCNAYNVRVLIWLRNGNQIEDFTNQDVPSSDPQMSGAFMVFLNSSDNDGQNNLNVTSTLVGMASDFQTNDRIACPEAAGDTLVLNFTTNTPVPDGFQVSVSEGGFNIIWDPAFNVMYGIELYLIEASNGFISCSQMCSPSGDNPCRCSGLTAGMDGNITVTAVTCGNQQGPPAVIYVTPRVPGQVSACSSYPVYNASNMLYRIETTWNQVMNPSELTAGVDQNVIDYSVSFNGQATLTNCSNTSSSNCLYVRPPTTTLSTVSVAARNIIGRGQERNCSSPSGAIGTTNEVFVITLSTTNLNRSVDCRRQMQTPQPFSCQFCIEIDNRFTCYDLENSGNGVANAALTGLEEGTYFYRVTAFLDGDPVALIYDFFSTACQPSELGASEEQINSSCLAVPNGRVCYDGTTAGSVATYTCDDGFTLMGSAERMCRSDGRWEGDLSTCDAIDSVPSWVIPLLGVSVVLWVLCLVEGVVSIPLIICLEHKSSKKNKCVTGFSYGLFAVEIILFLLIFILWMVYASDPKGLHGRNCIAAAFAFSLVLVLLSFIDSIPVLLYLKSAAEGYFSNNTEQNEPQQLKPAVPLKDEQRSTSDDGGGSDEEDEKQQRHKGVDQKR